MSDPRRDGEGLLSLVCPRFRGSEEFFNKLLGFIVLCIQDHLMHLGSSRLNSITSRLQPRWLRLGGLAVAACLTGTLLPAQDTPAQSGATPTLHVYTNLVQIPVLVLTPGRDKLYSPIAQNRFSISFDGGPWLRPAYARLRGG